MLYLQFISCCPGDKVLMSADGMVAVLADFGLAVRLPPDRDNYIDNRRPGTPKFQSKEVNCLNWAGRCYSLILKCPMNIL